MGTPSKLKIRAGVTDVLTATTSELAFSFKHSELAVGTKPTSELHEKSLQRSELVKNPYSVLNLFCGRGLKCLSANERAVEM